MSSPLFDKGPAESLPAVQAVEACPGTPRLRVPHRIQVEMRCASLDELLEGGGLQSQSQLAGGVFSKKTSAGVR